MSVYSISGENRKKLIAKWKPLLDDMLTVGPNSTLLKTSLIFSISRNEDMKVSYVGRVKYIPKYGMVKKEVTSMFNILQTRIQTLPNCCGIMLMNGGSKDLSYDSPYLSCKKDAYMWTTFCQMLFEYADIAGYGKVLATDANNRTDGIAKRLDVEVISKFKNPRTHNPISVYFKHIKDG